MRAQRHKRLPHGATLRRLLTIALQIPTAHDFRVISVARAHERLHVHNEINAEYVIGELEPLRGGHNSNSTKQDLGTC